VGGCAVFRPGDPPTFAQVATPVDRGRWRVAWTGRKVSTGSMIRSVRERHPVGDPIYARIGRLAEDALLLLTAGDVDGLGAALQEGQALLEELGASPAWAGEAARRLSASSGVLGARLSGAGGGDCVVMLVDDPEAAAAAVADVGLTLLEPTVDPVGLVVEGPR